jgi:hypothetical protein
MAIEAASQCSIQNIGDSTTYTLSDVRISVAMILAEGGSTELVFDLWSDRDKAHTFGFKVSTVSAGSTWTEHATGMIRVDDTPLHGR